MQAGAMRSTAYPRTAPLSDEPAPKAAACGRTCATDCHMPAKAPGPNPYHTRKKSHP